jgi:hypothetical protein
VGIGTVIEPVPVTGFAANFSPIPRMAPPPLGREIDGVEIWVVFLGGLFPEPSIVSFPIFSGTSNFQSGVRNDGVTFTEVLALKHAAIMKKRKTFAINDRYVYSHPDETRKRVLE